MQPADHVLDLACGDGFLLQQIDRERSASLTGVDLSTGELTLARNRLGNRVLWLQGRARALPFADHSFDRVLCHLALMLMDDIEEVVRELRRVPVPGGTFETIVSAEPVDTPDKAWSVVTRHLRQCNYADAPRPGDARCRTARGLTALFGDGSHLQPETRNLTLSLDPEGIWRFLVDSYNPAMMTETDLDRLAQDRLSDLRANADDDSQLRCILGYRQVSASWPRDSALRQIARSQDRKIARSQDRKIARSQDRKIGRLTS